MTVKSYLLSLPERVVRSALGLTAGVAREVGEVALPEGVRRSQLYQTLVETTLRFLIEQVGDVRGVYEGQVFEKNFLARRTAGNVVEALGVVAFRASPVWVLAALADLCGAGRHLIPEVAEALKAQGLLEKDTEFATIDQLLDGLERTSSRLASTINAPPLDVAGLRHEWEALRADAGRLPVGSLPSRDAIGHLWSDLKAESARQHRSVFETSSVMALSAARQIPDSVRWLTASTRAGASRTGHLLAATLMEHYRDTLAEIQRTGYASYVSQQLGPYFHAAAAQFSPQRLTFTERLVTRVSSWRRHRSLHGQR